jgi:hypothetical protein
LAGESPGSLEIGQAAKLASLLLAVLVKSVINVKQQSDKTT